MSTRKRIAKRCSDAVQRVLTLLTLAVTVSPCAGADLASIRRALGKEPAYQSGSPRYCLLVFGPEAKTRVWVVVDGQILYADRNSNGDLTEAGEKKRAITWGGKEGTFFECGALTTINGKKVHLALRHHPQGDQPDQLTISVEGRDVQYASSDWRGPLKFAARAQDAPIVHFDGPLSMRPFAGQALVRGRGVQDLSTMLGTPGLGPGTFAALACAQVPPDVHPVAEMEFPPRLAGRESRKLRVRLDQRC